MEEIDTGDLDDPLETLDWYGKGESGMLVAGVEAGEIGSYLPPETVTRLGELAAGPITLVASSHMPERSKILVFSNDEWTAFIAGVKNNEFDLD